MRKKTTDIKDADGLNGPPVFEENSVILGERGLFSTRAFLLQVKRACNSDQETKSAIVNTIAIPDYRSQTLILLKTDQSDSLATIRRGMLLYSPCSPADGDVRLDLF